MLTADTAERCHTQLTGDGNLTLSSSASVLLPCVDDKYGDVGARSYSPHLVLYFWNAAVYQTVS